MDLLCEKLKLYGFAENTVKWSRAFLTGRQQKVRIGKTLAEAVTLTSGVPQGGINHDH